MIVEEEPVTRVGFVITAKTPQLSKRFKYFHATANRFFLKVLVLKSPMQKDLPEEIKFDRQAEKLSRKMFNPDWCG